MTDLEEATRTVPFFVKPMILLFLIICALHTDQISWIGGRGTTDAPPVHFFSFSCSFFWVEIVQNQEAKPGAFGKGNP